MTLKIVCSKFYLDTKSDQWEMRYFAKQNIMIITNLHCHYKVRMEDQVIFASEKTEGQYIHTSSRNYHQSGITLHGNKLASYIVL